MIKLLVALTLATAVAVPMALQSSEAHAQSDGYRSPAHRGYACRIAGRWYQGRCPDRVAALGTDGRAHWYQNRFRCTRNGYFLHWGHC